MSKRMWSGVLASIVCGAVGLAAAQDPPTGQSGAAASKSMTVTGCIQRADMPAAGAAGTPATPATSADDQTKYVLKNVSSSSPSSSTAGTAGTAGTTAGTAAASAMGAMASEYRLDGDDAKLSPHVGHKVEITGWAAKPAGAAQPPTAASPKLKVDSVKMISATCP